MYRKIRRLVPMFLVLCMLLTMPGIAFAEKQDISGHWAEKDIKVWMEKDILTGYPDGTFKPDNSMTRAEFIALINRCFGFNKTMSFEASDVSPADWFAEDLSKAKAQGYLDVLGDKLLKPNVPVTREEVVAMAGNILRLSADEGAANTFSDAGLFSNWAKGYIGAVTRAGYIKGYPNNTFQSGKSISRAEVITILHKAIGELYDAKGIYGSDEIVKTIEGNVTVNKAGITLKNLVIQGNLYLTEGIGDGSAILDQVKVLGNTVISGGTKGIIIKNSVLEEVLINTPYHDPLYLIALGSSMIGTVHIQSDAKLEEKDLKGPGFGNVILEGPKGVKLELSGDFDKVVVNAAVSEATILKGTIKLLEINGKDTIVNAGNGVRIEVLTINCPAKMKGKCFIGTANINSSNVSVETTPGTVNRKDGLTDVTVGPPEGTGGGGGSGGGGGGNEPPQTIPEVVSIGPLGDVNAENGTISLENKLPKTVVVLLNNNKTVNANVIWDAGTPEYNGIVPGEYIFSGTLTGVNNPRNHKASVKVIVGPVRVTGVDPQGDIMVPNGTLSLSGILPQKTSVSLSDGTKADADVEWNQGAPAYNGNVPGNYTFEGNVSGVNNPQGYKASVKVIVGDITVSGVDNLVDISVAYGTAVLENILPSLVSVSLSNGTRADASVSWDAGVPEYSGTIPGEYVFSGTLSGINNPSNHKASVRVIVEPLTITSAEKIKDRIVIYGTEKAQIGLPKTIEITLSNKVKARVNVEWSNDSYNGKITGDYTFTGALALPEDILNPNNVSPSAKVTVYKGINPNPDTPLSSSQGTTIYEFDNIAEWWDGTTLPPEFAWWKWDTASLAKDTSNTISGEASIKFTPTDPIPYSDYYYFSGITSGPELGNMLEDMNNMEFSIYIPERKKVDFIQIKLFTNSDHTAFFENGIGAWELSSGWNKIRRAKEDFTPVVYDTTVSETETMEKFSTISRISTSNSLDRNELLQQKLDQLNKHISDQRIQSIQEQPARFILPIENSNLPAIVEALEELAAEEGTEVDVAASEEGTEVDELAAGEETVADDSVAEEGTVADDPPAEDETVAEDEAAAEDAESTEIITPEIEELVEEEQKTENSELEASEAGARSESAASDEVTALEAFIMAEEAGAPSWNNVTRMEFVVAYKEGNLTSINVDRVAFNTSGKAKLLFTFDDAWLSVLTRGKPILDGKGFKGTTWVNKEAAEGHWDDGAFMDINDLQEIYEAGWDIGNHTVEHPDDESQYSDEQLREQYLVNQEWMETNGWLRGARHVCYPSGSYSDRLINILQEIGVKSARTTVHGITPTPVTDMYKLKCAAVGRDTNIDQYVLGEIDRAVKTGSTLFLMLHRVEVSPEPDDGINNYGQITVSTADLQRIVDYADEFVQSGDLDVVTISEWFESYLGNETYRD